jgi:ubiquinone/menaquinone biosynthesis C-methylase UbiE
MDHLEAGRQWEANAEAWTVMSRAGYDRCRDVFNTPTFMRILPRVQGFHGLDIGCGEGHNTRLLAERGARMTGLDIAPTFVRHAMAKERERPHGIHYVRGSAQSLPFPDATFNFATAFMSFQDIPDQALAVSEAHRVLKPGGFFQFSITHPCFQTSKWGWVLDENGRRTALTVGDYFQPDGHCHWDEWTFGAAPDELKSKYPKFKTTYFRRTLSSWMNLLLHSGFRLEEVAEPMPDDEALKQNPSEYDARLVAYFLITRWKKMRNT